MDQCIFCKIARKELSSEIVFENEKIIAFRDVAPVAPTHILVIPKEHVESLNELEEKDYESMIPEIFLCIQELVTQQGLKEEGYRVVSNCGQNGGQTVGHLHFHLLGGRSMQWPPG
ncbi:MAG: histidine triad nucleotide-binding protein [Tindallia sp. MSAO_Bac2]|nr:MAG: histidine triad nucleotide-binding protein [Tindallia sp. MSAO_Bac2]